MYQKRAAITGVTSGIGAATAKVFQQRGIAVVGFDRNEPDFEIDEFHKFDLGDAGSVDAVTAGLVSQFDYLCNIVGVPPTQDKHTVLRVNFFGVRHFTDAIGARLRDGASVVTVASLAGINWRNSIDVVRSGLATPFDQADAWIEAHGEAGAASYHLSKELVIGWTVTHWDTWRTRGIRINTVSPGPVATSILSDFIETLGKRAEEDLKLNRAATAEEIALVILFLCSDESSWINGADIPADGGAGANALRRMLGLEP